MVKSAVTWSGLSTLILKDFRNCCRTVDNSIYLWNTGYLWSYIWLLCHRHDIHGEYSSSGCVLFPAKRAEGDLKHNYFPMTIIFSTSKALFRSRYKYVFQMYPLMRTHQFQSAEWLTRFQSSELQPGSPSRRGWQSTFLMTAQRSLIDSTANRFRKAWKYSSTIWQYPLISSLSLDVFLSIFCSVPDPAIADWACIRRGAKKCRDCRPKFTQTFCLKFKYWISCFWVMLSLKMYKRLKNKNMTSNGWSKVQIPAAQYSAVLFCIRMWAMYQGNKI